MSRPTSRSRSITTSSTSALPRHGEEKRTKWADFSDPTRMEPGADLMLLHPDGSGRAPRQRQGRLRHGPVRLLRRRVGLLREIHRPEAHRLGYSSHPRQKQEDRQADGPDLHAEPGRGTVGEGFSHAGEGQGVACVTASTTSVPAPRPAARSLFTSNRNAYVPPRGYPTITLQLHSMDDDGTNVEQIGFINIACALHPVILKDGRVLFSTLESQGMHNSILWASGAFIRTARTGPPWSAASPRAARPAASTSRRNSPTKPSSWRSTTT